jgi:hypothetical protein
MNKKGKIGGMIIGMILGYFFSQYIFLYVYTLTNKVPSSAIAVNPYTWTTVLPFTQLIGVIIGGYVGFKYTPI